MTTPRSSGRAGAGVARGGARPSVAELEQRIRELEDRLMGLEARPGSAKREPFRFDRYLPPDASRHFKTAAREQLLGMRVLVDHWIGKIERSSRRDDERETIPVE